MPAPPKGDPLRPLYLAGESLYNFGLIVVIVVSVLAVIVLSDAYSISRVLANGVGLAIFVAGCVAPSSLLFVLGFHVRRYKLWAVFTAIPITALTTVCTTLVALRGLHELVTDLLYGSHVGKVDVIVLVIFSLFTAALATLTRQLYVGQRFLRTKTIRGFSVLPDAGAITPPVPVLTVPEDENPNANDPACHTPPPTTARVE